MEKIRHNGEEGVFYPKKEYIALRETVLAYRERIAKLERDSNG